MGKILAEVTRTGLSRSQINTLINDWIFSARDRKILRAKLLEGITYEQIAEDLRPQMSPRQVKRIVARCVEEMEKHF